MSFVFQKPSKTNKDRVATCHRLWNFLYINVDWTDLDKNISCNYMGIDIFNNLCFNIHTIRYKSYGVTKFWGQNCNFQKLCRLQNVYRVFINYIEVGVTIENHVITCFFLYIFFYFPNGA